MGHRLLYQPHAAGRIGKIFARSQDCASSSAQEVAQRKRRPRIGEPSDSFVASMRGSRREICYTQSFGAVPKWPKGEVCKTSIRGFESHPRLHIFSVRYKLSPMCQAAHPFVLFQLTASIFPRSCRVALASSSTIGSCSHARRKSASTRRCRASVHAA